MSDAKITALTAADDIDDADLLPIVKAGANRKATAAQMRAGLLPTSGLSAALAALGVAMDIESPLDIPDCALWLDASDATTINAGSPVDNDPVTTWADKSGNDYDATQASADNRPVYKTNIQNGKAVIRFDPASFPQFLELSGAALGLLNNKPGVTIACAGRNTSGNDAQIIWVSSGTSVDRDRAQLLSGGTEAYISATNADASFDQNNQHLANEPGNPFVQIGRAQMANNIIVDLRITAQWVFQTPAYAGSPGNFPATNSLAILIGNYYDTGSPASGSAEMDMYELAVWPRCLTLDELNQVFRLFSSNWAFY